MGLFMKLKLHLVLLFVITLVMLWQPCVAADKYYMISHAGSEDPFWRIVFNGAEAAAKEMGVKIKFLSPEKPNDMKRQVELFKTALSKDAKGVATTISDNRAFASLLTYAKNNLIPVVAFNSRPIDDDRVLNPYLAYIGMDDYLAGKTVGERILNSRKIKRHLVVANQQKGLTGLESRFKGIKEVLSRKNIKVVNLDVSSDPKKIQKIMFKYVQNNKDLEGIVTLGPASLHPIGRLVKKIGLNVYIASFDITPETIQHIKEGIVSFTFDQQPYLQGYLSVKMLVLNVKYKISPTDVNTGVGIIDTSNVIEVEALAKENIR